METSSLGPTSTPTIDAPVHDQAHAETLRREIQTRLQNIQDLEAAVVMERTKLVDNPDYDQTFLNECLQEQDHSRMKIEKASALLQQLAPARE